MYTVRHLCFSQSLRVDALLMRWTPKFCDLLCFAFYARCKSVSVWRQVNEPKAMTRYGLQTQNYCSAVPWESDTFLSPRKWLFSIAFCSPVLISGKFYKKKKNNTAVGKLFGLKSTGNFKLEGFFGTRCNKTIQWWNCELCTESCLDWSLLLWRRFLPCIFVNWCPCLCL